MKKMKILPSGKFSLKAVSKNLADDKNRMKK